MSDQKQISHRSWKSIADDQRIENELSGLDPFTDPFVAAVHATRMPMIITNPRLADNPVVFANDAFCRLTGYERDEILGRNCRFLQGEATDQETRRQLHQAVEHAHPVEVDIRNYRKNGEPFWNRLLMAPVFDADKKLSYFFASQVDVTLERERLSGLERDNAALVAEVSNRLRTQEERERELALALRAGGFGTWSFELQSRTLTASEDCKALFGRALDQPFTFEDRIAAVHDDDRRRAIDNMIEAGTQGREHQEEYRIIWPDGSTRWISSRGQPFFDVAGRPVRVAGVSMDITHAKRAELKRQALVRLNDLFRDLDQSADISHAAAEILGQTLDVSRAGYGMVDRINETIMIERDWNAPGVTTIAGTLQFRAYGSYIEDLKQGETVCVDDSRLDPRTADTSAVLEAISARAFINMPLHEQGGFVALIFVNNDTPRHWSDDDVAFVREVAERTRDAVERRRAEHELAELAASLERQVAERTAELLRAEDALRQSQKMEAVGQLTGGLAHDFNNLLTGIGGGLELIQLRLAQGRAAEIGRYMDAAQDAVKRAAALTHRLLAFSRRQTLDPRPTDANALVSGLEDLVRRTVGPAILVETRLAADLESILVDPSQLENALLNLCINARDAMPDGGRLMIETQDRLIDDQAGRAYDITPGNYICLSVSDTGTGMDAETMSRAFEPFFTTKPIGSGTGLGLSMVYGFARQSGGHVHIHSTPGMGTTVAVYLPRNGRAVMAEASPALLSAAPYAQGSETVLVVDDEASIRMLIIEALADLGYDVLEAPDGPTAMELLAQGRMIDLLVTDVGLPGMNGRQLADALRTTRPGLKVVFITGYAENAVLNHDHLEAGMQIITKPFTMEVLASRIKALLS
ncbi:PAS domain-containing protein [Sphingobium sp. TKS]|uniref:PAS domain-containing protein n=1 Tax=Sphingobium sp. TKS TaxID=1315974 RepID=UPI0007705792|nr:PAS domain-containing protein [Sphingobium sp. TKS]AMK26251.1 multi-sensor hybrid histidine kinase [Sphingobium sp. TKS]